jgi:hypothetical protein
MPAVAELIDEERLTSGGSRGECEHGGLTTAA